MSRLLTLTALVLALAATLSAQGRNVLDRVVPPCEKGLLLKMEYNGFGMISTPSGARVYLQICRDGRASYQTARGQVRTEILNNAKMNQVKAKLASPDVEGLDSHYSAPPAIDASVSLFVAIPREGRTQVVKADNLLTGLVPSPLKQLLNVADSFRSDAGFTVADFKVP